LSTNLMSVVVFFLMHNLYPCKIGANVGVNILGNKKLLALVEPNFFIPRRWKTLWKWSLLGGDFSNYKVNTCGQDCLLQHFWQKMFNTCLPSKCNCKMNDILLGSFLTYSLFVAPPKFLVDPLEGPSMWQCGSGWNLGHDPDFQH
jgi:hypothetical protein